MSQIKWACEEMDKAFELFAKEGETEAEEVPPQKKTQSQTLEELKKTLDQIKDQIKDLS